MKKVRLVLVVLLALFLSGCQTERHNSHNEKDAEYTSETSPEDCYLCGGGIEGLMLSYWGQENVAIFSLNTFDVAPLEINRYDRLSKQKIEEYAGAISMGREGSTENGFSINYMLEYDRGYASGTVMLRDDDEVDISKTAEFLCSDCLNKIFLMETDRYLGIGVICLDTKEFKAIERIKEGAPGFGVGDFHFVYSLNTKKDGERQMEILVFYNPIRYEIPPEQMRLQENAIKQ